MGWKPSPPTPSPASSSASEDSSSSDPEAEHTQDQNVDSVHDSASIQNDSSDSGLDDSSDNGSNDSRESWEKDIKRWDPGQRPPLENHPYDMWNNRPTARFGKGGWRPPALGNRRDSDVEASPSNQEEEASNKGGAPRLRGGWIDADDLDWIENEDFGSEDSTIAYDTDEMEVTDEASDVDSYYASEEELPFGDVQTHPRTTSNKTTSPNSFTSLDSLLIVLSS
ncbi:MAG: hypothetical protein Q9191_003558 [Dirinaria sp. TL-2023a]